jgi:4-hydroxy-tetrahydrodipicolinate reductase
LDLDEPEADQIHINAKRIGTVPGTHTVTYNSAVDIEIKHTAHNREDCSWCRNCSRMDCGKHGVFSMKDVLELK